MKIFRVCVWLLIAVQASCGPAYNSGAIPITYIRAEIYDGAHDEADSMAELSIYYAAGPFPRAWLHDGEVEFNPYNVEGVERYSNTFENRMLVYNEIVKIEDQFASGSRSDTNYVRSRRAPYILINMLRRAHEKTNDPIASFEREMLSMARMNKATELGYYWLMGNNGPNVASEQYLKSASLHTNALRRILND